MLVHFIVIGDSQPEVAEDEPEHVEIDEPRQQSSEGTVHKIMGTTMMTRPYSGIDRI
jgi:hypothetical protein